MPEEHVVLRMKCGIDGAAVVVPSLCPVDDPPPHWRLLQPEEKENSSCSEIRHVNMKPSQTDALRLFIVLVTVNLADDALLR